MTGPGTAPENVPGKEDGTAARVVSREDGMERTEKLAERIAARCTAAGLRVGVAESCTGGLVAAALSSRPGASAWLRGGVVSYATDVKRGLLGVDAGLLADKGPVSAEVAAAMARGARLALGADLAVSVTGLAGPDGDPERDIPVGTVFLGWSGPNGSGAEKRFFSGNRGEVRAAARDAALELLLRVS